MTRYQRTQVLIDTDAELAHSLAKEVQDSCSVVVVQEPEDSLVMVQVREGAKGSRFYLGEVLVTEAKVQLAGVLGLGLVRGHEPQRALDLAIIDAAYAAEIAVVKQWEGRLLEAEQKRLEDRRQRAQEILQTRVSFESMQEEDV